MGVDVVDKYVEERMAELMEEAMRIASEHEAWRRYENDRLKTGKSVLRAYVRSRGKTSLVITWKRIGFYKQGGNHRRGGKWEITSSDINKGKGVKYPMDRLLAHAQPWEADAVASLEARFAKLREEAGGIKRLWLAHLYEQRIREERLALDQ